MSDCGSAASAASRAASSIVGLARLCAAHRVLGGGRAAVDRADAGQRDPDLADVAVLERDLDRDGSGRIVAHLALELEVRPARPRARIRHADLGDHLVGRERRRERPAEQLVDRDRPLAARALSDDVGSRGEHDGAPVALRVRVCERAADGAAVADEWVGDLRGGVAERAIATAEQLGLLAGLVARERADAQRSLVLLDVIEVGHAVQVDDDVGSREAHLHERDEALAAGEHLGLVPSLDERRDHLLERRRREVLESRGIHEASSPFGRSPSDRSSDDPGYETGNGHGLRYGERREKESSPRRSSDSSQATTARPV